jgi:hypothetical protein
MPLDLLKSPGLCGVIGFGMAALMGSLLGAGRRNSKGDFTDAADSEAAHCD